VQVKRKLAAVDSKLEYFWGLTLYHRDDITFNISDTPYVPPQPTLDAVPEPPTCAYVHPLDSWC
jgi:hypothetical protein